MTWQGKSRGGLTGYKIFVFILKFFGIKTAYLVLKFVIVYFVFFAPKASYITYLFFKNHLKQNIFKSIINIFKNYYIFGTILLDKTALISDIKTDYNFVFDGEKYLQELNDLDCGGILISSHIGNWEIAGQLLIRIKKKINIIMLDQEYEKIKNYLSNNVYKTKNFNIIVLEKNIDHTYKIIEALNNKEIVCMHGDRFLEGNKIIAVDFLGDKAYFPIGPFVLAKASKVPVSFVFAMKEDNFHYHFYAEPLRYYNDNMKENNYMNLKNWVQEFAYSLEKMVKKYPTQWFNYYDFWRIDDNKKNIINISE
jgi:predicted LPLAT superfamily acyltransferase